MVDWNRLPKQNSVLCIYMGVGNLEPIASKLIGAGFDPNMPVVCVEWATLGRQRVCRSRLNTVVVDAEEFCLNSPAVIIVGENAKMGEEISWFEDKPLQGLRFVVTRSKGQASDLSEMLEKRGAEVLGLPLISISKNVDEETMDDVFAGIASYDWIVFLQSQTEYATFSKPFSKPSTIYVRLDFCKIAAVGKATAKEIKEILCIYRFDTERSECGKPGGSIWWRREVWIVRQSSYCHWKSWPRGVVGRNWKKPGRLWIVLRCTKQSAHRSCPAIQLPKNFEVRGSGRYHFHQFIGSEIICGPS